MSVTAESLRKLHRIHRQLTDLRERLRRGPKQISAAEANVARLQENNEQVQETLTRLRVACDEKQLHLKSAEDRISDVKRKRNECGTNKAYQALIEQIAADEMATSVLSDEILELLERVDDHANLLKEASQEVEKAAGDSEKVTQRVAGEQHLVEVDVGRLAKELAEAEKELPGEVKTEYDRVVKARGEGALTAVEADMCGGCYQMITSQMLNDLALSRPVFCKACGRLLYLPEGYGVI